MTAQTAVKLMISVMAAMLITCSIPGGIGPVSAEEGKVYVYAWEPWKPYQLKNENGDLTGLGIDMVRAVLENMDEPYKWQNTPWKRAIKDLKEGYLDAGLGASITEERKKWGLFSDPYRQESAVLFVRKEKKDAYDFETLEDIIGSDFTLGVTRGYYYGPEYERLMEQKTFSRHVEEVKVNENNYKKLRRGRIDGFLADPVSGTAGLKALGILDMVAVHPMKVFSNDIHVIFSKKRVSPEYVEKFNKSLKKVKKSGQYDRIMRRYMK